MPAGGTAAGGAAQHYAPVILLITGASGWVGRSLTPVLRSKFEVRPTDLQPHAEEVEPLDITDLGAVEKALRGVDLAIHLAIASGLGGEIEDEEFNRRRFEVNVWGTRTLFEGAVRAGVKRFIYTSSIMVVWGYGPGEPVPRNAEPRPEGAYALSKYLGEVIAKEYHRRHGIDVICMRIAHPVDPEDPSLREQPVRPQWIAMPDLCRAYLLAAQHAPSGFHIVHLTGESSRRRWELEAARDLFGYEPQIRLEDLGCSLQAGW